MINCDWNGLLTAADAVTVVLFRASLSLEYCASFLSLVCHLTSVNVSVAFDQACYAVLSVSLSLCPGPDHGPSGP